MTYFEVAAEIKRSRKIFNLWHACRLQPLFSIFSAYFTPLLVFAHVSPNSVTYARYLIGLASVFVACVISLKQIYIPVALYFTYYFLDYVDGDIARTTHRSSFLGRYIEALADVHVDSLIYISFSYLAFKEDNYSLWFWLGSFACFMSVMANLNIDRYSAFRRWIKEEHGADIGSHDLNYNLKVIRAFYHDLRFVLIAVTVFYGKVAIFFLCCLSLSWNSILFIYQMSLVYKNMGNYSDKPKHDGTGRVR